MDESQLLIAGTQRDRDRGNCQEAYQDDISTACMRARDQEEAYGEVSWDSDC